MAKHVPPADEVCFESARKSVTLASRMSFIPSLRILMIATLSLPATLRAVEPVPAFTPGARILFQGDSITDGNRGRSADPNHILGHGYAFIVAAKFGAAFPELNLDFMNRGVSG